MALADFAYPTLVYVHLLLFVLWLGADVGVFVLGQHFRRRETYTLDQRIALLKLLVIIDLTPRTAWALMVPISLTVSYMGGWWDLPLAIVLFGWAIAAVWLWLVFDAHNHDMTPRAARDRKIEGWIRYLLCAGYLFLGAESLLTNHPIEPDWLAWKALLFGLIFAAAIMIDVAFKPVGAQLGRLLTEGSSDETEIPLRRTMDRTRIWVWAVYLLLLVTAFLGNVKPIY
ncbi:hypothetical protein G6N82_04780 [Altererythrobacter sp. BO-6]|uniref:hypothetical protein n=1 Tax=Altererythrobacter sp. BO-6 TaxID=2604537 RepID=UPI0013E11FFE|nr:hypothetical protein [Altererythrobacter sp. BO-6]QIG53553.1 hypothetical protein G6N82_04780 [Altererythrobacter sp. BO-6]